MYETCPDAITRLAIPEGSCDHGNTRWRTRHEINLAAVQTAGCKVCAAVPCLPSWLYAAMYQSLQAYISFSVFNCHCIWNDNPITSMQLYNIRVWNIGCLCHDCD